MMMPSIFGNNFVDDVFDDMFPFAGNYTTANYDLMKTDVKDAGDHYELEMEMPGVEKENIKAERQSCPAMQRRMTARLH